MLRLAPLVFISTLGCSDRTRAPRTAQELIDICSPGRSWDACRKATESRVPLPAGRLQKLVHSFDGFENGSEWGFLTYELVFDGDASDVRAQLEKALGMMTREVPAHFPPNHLVGDMHWMTPEGIWELHGTTVSWYSNPFSARPDLTDASKLSFDQFVRPAPSTQALWQHLGTMLVGTEQAKTH